MTKYDLYKFIKEELGNGSKDLVTRLARIIGALSVCTMTFIVTNSFAIANDSDVLSKEYLLNNEWGPDIGELGLDFKFTMNDTFETDANFEGGAYYSGTYKIVDNRLILKIIKAGEGRELIDKELVYELVSDDDAIYFNKYLQIENAEMYKDRAIKRLWNHSTVVKTGQKRTYQNIKVETINDQALLNESANYYELPSITSKRFMFSIHDDNLDKLSDLSYVVPPQALGYKNVQVHLILRTVRKNGSKGHWYCIVLPIGTGGYDIVKLEGLTDYWNGKNLGWVKEADIKEIIKK